MTTPIDGRSPSWPADWHPTSAADVAEALIAELRNALVPVRYRMRRDGSEELKQVERVLEMADVCAERLGSVPRGSDTQLAHMIRSYVAQLSVTNPVSVALAKTLREYLRLAGFEPQPPIFALSSATCRSSSLILASRSCFARDLSTSSP